MLMFYWSKNDATIMKVDVCCSWSIGPFRTSTTFAAKMFYYKHLNIAETED